MLAPAGIANDVVARLNAEVNKALASPDVHDKLVAAGIDPVGGSPAQFGAFIQSEMLRSLLPSVGPDFGKRMDQAAALKTRDFPTAMLLPRAFT